LYEQENFGGTSVSIPAMMVVPVCCMPYSVRVCSSRTTALACVTFICLLAIVGPWNASNFRTISDFSQVGIGKAFKDVFDAGVRFGGRGRAGEGGQWATDWHENLRACASRHKAMSYGSMKKAVERMRRGHEALVTQVVNRQDEAEDAALGQPSRG